MSLASEVITWQESSPATEPDGVAMVRFRTRVRTNATAERFNRRLATLGLLALAERIDGSATLWHWCGTGQGYEILWRDATTFADLIPLARL